MTLSDGVAAAETALQHYELKSDADDRMIELLKKQNAEQANELAEIKHTHKTEMLTLRQERDVAQRAATEVSGLLETMGAMVLSGVRKMRGDQTPPVKSHLQTVDPRLPALEMQR